LGSVFTVRSIPTWYAGLEKPPHSPPNWVFGPVWTALFLLMGISAYLIWRQGAEKKQVKTALSIYSIQLVLNFFWSVIFFGLRRPDLAFFELIILWLFIALNIAYFYKISKASAILLVPYILWVSFAGYLNFSIWMYNDPRVDSIKAEINKANYCSSDRDCIVIDSKCPFDCIVTVNKDQSERISKLINSYQSKCAYGCALLTGAACREGKCVLKK
jgi:tryptophan-rich sensory protein